MSTQSTKPRLLFFSGPHEHLETLRVVGLIEPVRQWLAWHFDLIELAGDRDLSQEIERHTPDLVMFDGACDSYIGRPTQLSGLRGHPEVPRVGFVRNDFHSPMRVNAYARMEAWGAEAFFSPSFPRDGAPRAWAQRTIFVPRFADDDLFRDYGEAKCIPVAMLGAGFFASDFYPWRRRVAPLIAGNFPFIHAPRPMPRPHMIVGEQFARMINRSYFTLSCGGASHTLVSKVFEIPGARSVLVTEETAPLRDMGFVDGENCIFTDAGDIVGRLQGLLDHPGELEALTERGFRFVQTHHTHRQRTQLREWLDLRRGLGAGERIVQTSATAPLEVLPSGAAHDRHVPFGATTVLAGLRDGFAAIDRGDPGAASAALQNTLSAYPYMLEGLLGVGIARFMQGDWAQAQRCFAQNVNYLAACHSTVTDPVNLAYLCLTFLATNDVETAARHAARSPAVRHPALQVARWLVSRASPGHAGTTPFDVQAPDDTTTQSSLDPRAPRPFGDWLREAADLLGTCGNTALREAAGRSGLL